MRAPLTVRRVLGAGLLALLAAAVPGSATAREAAPAQAAGREAQAQAAQARDADSYRYWSFWEGDGSGGSWSYATEGPSVLRPGDGDVLGFRFSLSEDSGDAAKPRADVEFEKACARTETEKDRKRVAIGIDFGTPADAPGEERPPEARAACASVAEDATAAEALASVAEPLRYDSSALLCAIDGYPRRGCGEMVKGADKDAGKGADQDGGSGTGADDSSDGGGASADDGGEGDGALGPVAGVAAGGAAVALLAAAAVRQSRRRRG